LSRLAFIIVGEPRIPALEQRSERAVERLRSGLQQQVRAALGPLHLMPLGKALADDAFTLRQGTWRALAVRVALRTHAIRFNVKETQAGQQSCC